MNDDEQTPSKPARTPKQLESLARARAKAYEVRKANAERRAKEKEVDAKLMAEYKAMRKSELDARHKNLHPADEESLEPLVEEEDPEEEVVEERRVRVKKRPPVRRRVVVVEEDSDSEPDGEELTTVKIPKPRDEVLERVKASMFGF